MTGIERAILAAAYAAFFVAGFWACPASAKTYRVHFVEAHDVDTYRIDRMAFDDQMQMRADGWNGPELDTAQCAEERALAIAGRDMLNALGKRSTKVIITNPKKDKYGGRWRAKKVRFMIDGKSVDPFAQIAAAGYLVPYKGEARDPMAWCHRLAPKMPVDLLPPDFVQPN